MDEIRNLGNEALFIFSFILFIFLFDSAVLTRECYLYHIV